MKLIATGYRQEQDTKYNCCEAENLKTIDGSYKQHFILQCRICKQLYKNIVSLGDHTWGGYDIWLKPGEKKFRFEFTEWEAENKTLKENRYS
jgi:hypothetical protein